MDFISFQPWYMIVLESIICVLGFLEYFHIEVCFGSNVEIMEHSGGKDRRNS